MIDNRPLRWVLCVALGVAFGACSPALWQGLAEGYAASQGAGAAKLMLFGGQGHDTYLGCLSCSEYSSDSLFNQYGTHGSSYSMASIFNQYSPYGSRYSTHSACNPYASDPPVVVDDDGNYYGRLTINEYRSDAFGDAQFLAWLRGVCQ